ncbi:hypothetical protein CPAR01_09807 [Colletotrichum paranaense]|uniref:Uncharacterized protein n=2 Tax=Colletotrichum acutatum species complex TaxID=2707335 RepID=A0AAI9U5X1_9PEZI|nr:uncharacterized protein CPAR01_09807 [Colletotrichum paranaense]KAK1452284.1 hypothetical protein CMEL01_06858 [Colletotrichum melonis]KAK1536265.1 hypothetical protein CPAR01_09807 [Colletotrichum paranaense]
MLITTRSVTSPTTSSYGPLSNFAYLEVISDTLVEGHTSDGPLESIKRQRNVVQLKMGTTNEEA